MNVRKPVDYTAMFAALDEAMAASLPQMEQYFEIGRLISGRPEKGAAVAAAEYLCATYPDTPGFSPRNLRRMREFYRTYESIPEVLTKAREIGWTRNVVILEAELTIQEKTWYIQAVRQFGWSKLELQRQISVQAHLEIALDFVDEVCYTEENSITEDASSHAAAQDSQRYGTGGSGSTDGISDLLCMFHPEVLRRGIHPQTLLVLRWRGWPIGMEDGTGPPGCDGLWQAVFQEGWACQPGEVSRPGQLPVQRV